jgi:hypothetical protein|tara:strand:+ start:317 stop:499 length:183 start_codon:yes stop_codon:yes gene_type:complete
MKSNTILVILMLVLVASLPLAGIWSFNTLFNLGIQYTLATWSAMLFLMLLFVPKKTGDSK